MISSTAEYALRAIVELATHPESACTAQQIAVVGHIPSGYVSKVLQDLGRAGLVTSQRGPNGGFTLARNRALITVLEVINAVDPIRRIRICPLGIPQHGAKLCPLHQRLDDAIRTVEDAFGSTTIEQLIEPEEGGSRCLFPPVPRPVEATVSAQRRSTAASPKRPAKPAANGKGEGRRR